MPVTLHIEVQGKEEVEGEIEDEEVDTTEITRHKQHLRMAHPGEETPELLVGDNLGVSLRAEETRKNLEARLSRPMHLSLFLVSGMSVGQPLLAFLRLSRWHDEAASPAVDVGTRLRNLPLLIFPSGFTRISPKAPTSVPYVPRTYIKSRKFGLVRPAGRPSICIV
jgi:hypothetical protein